jgi:hypothetical protein
LCVCVCVFVCVCFLKLWMVHFMDQGSGNWQTWGVVLLGEFRHMYNNLNQGESTWIKLSSRSFKELGSKLVFGIDENPHSCGGANGVNVVALNPGTFELPTCVWSVAWESCVLGNCVSECTFAAHGSLAGNRSLFWLFSFVPLRFFLLWITLLSLGRAWQ